MPDLRRHDHGNRPQSAGAPGAADPGVVVVLHVADSETVKSVKATLMTALLVRAVRAPCHWRRRGVHAAAVAGGVVLAEQLQHHQLLLDVIHAVWTHLVS